MQRGEGIVSDLRLGGRDGGEEGRFAGVREADEADVGDQFQAQHDRALDPRLAGVGAARRAVGRGGEMGVAEAAVAACGHDDALARPREVGDHRARSLLEHLRADRHLQHRVGAAAARPVLAHAVYAGLGLEMLLIAKVDQRVEAVRALNHDVAAAPAVAAVGAAELDEFLAPERDAAGAAVARPDIDARLVEKFHGSLRSARPPLDRSRSG